MFTEVVSNAVLVFSPFKEEKRNSGGNVSKLRYDSRKIWES